MEFTKSHPIAAKRFAEGVDNGSIIAGKYVKLACRRFLADLQREDIWFDEAAAQRECNFIETLPHVKGKWAARGERLKLEPWQSFIECNLFGFKRPDGLRRFRESYEEVARKNAKSTRLAGRALYMLCADGEFGAEVYSGATNERQAWEVFRPMHQMVKRTPLLKRRYDIETPVKSLYILSNGSRAEPLVGKPGDGASPSFAVADEYHEHDTDALYETMLTGMGAREQPLMCAITTAGSNLSGPCYAKRADAVRILEGSVVDDTLFAIIFCPDEGDEWDSDAALIKANPNLDISVNRDFLESQRDKARRSASLQNAYKTKHLNLWVGASVAWMNMVAWQRQKRDYALSDFVGQRAWIGVDLASKKDLAAIAVLVPFESQFYTFFYFFAPEAAQTENEKYRNLADWIGPNVASKPPWRTGSPSRRGPLRITHSFRNGLKSWPARLPCKRWLSIRGRRNFSCNDCWKKDFRSLNFRIRSAPCPTL
jgi:phage terminase large subunit-like protein